MLGFLFDWLIDELIALLPRPLRILFWSVLGGGLAILLIWAILR